MSSRDQQVMSLSERQLAGIEAFNQARQASERAAELAVRSRETRMDASRRLEVIRREHEAVIARTDAQLRASGDLLARSGALRALVAHRHPWFSKKLVELLQRYDVHVVDQLENGAEAIGFVVAEQPDLVLVEDGLTMVPGDEVVREMRHYAPATLITAQVASSDRIGLLLDAGADKVVTRQLRPDEVVSQALALRPRR
jgi:CheY-like chemotaxis protein